MTVKSDAGPAVGPVKNAKAIFSPLTAQYLLKRGYKITKIKDDRNDPTKDVYIFETDENFSDVLRSYSSAEGHIKAFADYTNTKLVFERETAKLLLSNGFKIVDLKQNRNDKGKEVYVFEVDDEKLDYFLDILKSIE